MEEDEEFELVETTEDIDDYEDNELTGGDYFFVGFSIAIGISIIAVIFKLLKKNFKNFHLKIGNKLEIGADLKD